ncbi:MAG: class II fumarate hydratase [Fusobacterium sp.]|nr:class II fumarate hydratase [Fusobacterium sp.]
MENKEKFRIEHDTMGEVKVPVDKYWGAQTERSFQNFKIGESKIPKEIIYAFAVLKKAAAKTNFLLGVLDEKKSDLIGKVCDEILDEKLNDNFPLSVYQTGSGTQTNMNLNEVIANRGNDILGEKILHPNDDVNKSQSSNDTFPTAIHIAALCALEDKLVPAACKLRDEFKKLEENYMDIIKVGRTHLQDATPLTLGQEISAWRAMLDDDIKFLKEALNSLRELALGGTAVGTGLNAPKDFGKISAEEISKILNNLAENVSLGTISDSYGGVAPNPPKKNYNFVTAENKFQSLTSKSAIVYVHGAMKALATDLMKIANDIRWLASGPRCGIGEIFIPENEPGSSIMPGKVNPTQCEALTMVCVQVMGNDTTISVAASQGNFQLNVFMPVIINNFLESARLLTDACDSFRKNCVVGIKPNYQKINENIEKSLMLVTALNPHIGYENSAKIAKKAFTDGISLKEAAVKLNLLTEEEFEKIVDAKNMI